MENIKVGSTVQLKSPILFSNRPDYWRVLDIDGDIFKVGFVRKDGEVNLRRAPRFVTIDDIECVVPDQDIVQPIEQFEMKEENELQETKKQSRRRKTTPTWITNIPFLLTPYIRENVTLPELLTAAQKLMLACENEEEKKELHNYIKRNRRFVRKQLFNW